MHRCPRRLVSWLSLHPATSCVVQILIVFTLALWFVLFSFCEGIMKQIIKKKMVGSRRWWNSHRCKLPLLAMSKPSNCWEVSMRDGACAVFKRHRAHMDTWTDVRTWGRSKNTSISGTDARQRQIGKVFAICFRKSRLKRWVF